LKRVVERVEQVHLDIVGLDTLNGKLHALVEELHLTNHVKIHGSMPNDEVRPYFQRAHIYLVSSRHEGGPIAMLEAASCSVPTVGTRVGYVSDWENEKSLAVAIGDFDALAEAIVSLLGNPTRRKELGNASQHWARQYDVKWTAESLLHLYETLQS